MAHKERRHAEAGGIANAKAAAGGMMFGSMNAFGPEENFAFPPKPADPKAVWNIEWTAKARFRAFASFMTGMGGSGGMGSGSGMPAEPKKKIEVAQKPAEAKVEAKAAPAPVTVVESAPAQKTSDL